MEVGLVLQRADKTYVFRAPVLQSWVAYYYAGLELTGMPRQKVLDQLVAGPLPVLPSHQNGIQ
jgi:hypothetical protein